MKSIKKLLKEETVQDMSKGGILKLAFAKQKKGLHQFFHKLFLDSRYTDSPVDKYLKTIGNSYVIEIPCKSQAFKDFKQTVDRILDGAEDESEEKIALDVKEAIEKAQAGNVAIDIKANRKSEPGKYEPLKEESTRLINMLKQLISESKSEEKPSSGLTKKQKSSVVKKARAGKDIGKKGKGFEKVAKKAGGGEKGKKIAAASMWRNIKRK